MCYVLRQQDCRRESRKQLSTSYSLSDAQNAKWHSSFWFSFLKHVAWTDTDFPLLSIAVLAQDYNSQNTDVYTARLRLAACGCSQLTQGTGECICGVSGSARRKKHYHGEPTAISQGQPLNESTCILSLSHSVSLCLFLSHTLSLFVSLSLSHSSAFSNIHAHVHSLTYFRMYFLSLVTWPKAIWLFGELTELCSPTSLFSFSQGPKCMQP